MEFPETKEQWRSNAGGRKMKMDGLKKQRTIATCNKYNFPSKTVTIVLYHATGDPRKA